MWEGIACPTLFLIIIEARNDRLLKTSKVSTANHLGDVESLPKPHLQLQAQQAG